MSQDSEREQVAVSGRVRRSFAIFVASHGLSKLGDALMNPKTTLSWLGASLGAPTFMVAMLVPLRESGSLLLQWAVADWVERTTRRKWLWVGGSLLQAASAAGMAWVALGLEAASAGMALLVLVTALAGARSVCSLASKDLLGRCLPKARRGRAGGWASSLAGAATLAVAGAGLLLAGAGGDQRHRIAWVLGAAALAWVLAAGLFAILNEPRDAPPAGPVADHGGRRWRLLRDDPRLRCFVLTRSLLLCSALSAPYYVLLAQRHLNQVEAGWLGFVLLSGLAGVLAGPLWGPLADRSSRAVLVASAALAAMLGLLVFALDRWQTEALAAPWLLPAAYLALSLAHEGARIGRKTWIVNIVEGQQRRDYVAVSNSAMGLILLVLGSASAALAEYSLSAVLLVLTLLGAAGALLSKGLPEAEA